MLRVLTCSKTTSACKYTNFSLYKNNVYTIIQRGYFIFYHVFLDVHQELTENNARLHQNVVLVIHVCTVVDVKILDLD